MIVEMVAKLFLLQFEIFGYDIVKLARNDFHRNSIMDICETPIRSETFKFQSEKSKMQRSLSVR